MHSKRPLGEEARINGSDGFRFGSFWRRASTDALGQYRFCVGPGTYSVSLRGLATQDFVIDSQKEIVADLRVLTEILQGKVIDAQDQPVAGALVEGLYNRNHAELGSARVEKATTNDQGAFELERELVPLALMAKTG